MAGKGFAPNTDRSKVRRPNRGGGSTEVTPDGRRRGPSLPDDVLPKGESWHARTKAWWETWRKSAQAQTFGDTDWDFLLDTALMHHTMWSKARWEFAAELRLRAAKFGATPEDRARLKLQILEPEKPARKSGGSQKVTPIDSRRTRLLG